MSGQYIFGCRLYVDQTQKDLLAWPGFNCQNGQDAAQFSADSKINLDERRSPWAA